MNNELVYGFHAVMSLVENASDSIEHLIIQKGTVDSKLSKLLAFADKQHISIVHYSKAQIEALTKTSKHQGIVAVCKTTGVLLDEDDVLSLVEQLKRPAFLLILDGVQDPHNLGACLRSAAAANVDAVIAPKDRSVGLTPAARKVASGGAELCPFVQVTNLSRFMSQLKTLGVWLYGAEAGAAHTIFEVDVTGPMAWVLGAEGSGLRVGTRNACDYGVSIPMPGKIESLNVSVAAGICLFETVRQRLYGGRRSSMPPK